MDEEGGEGVASAGDEQWAIICASASVKRDWERLKARAPEALSACRLYIAQHPLRRHPGRAYPWRGQHANGVWEFEVTGGDRVLYRADPDTRIVVVLFAGPHPTGRYRL